MLNKAKHKNKLTQNKSKTHKLCKKPKKQKKNKKKKTKKQKKNKKTQREREERDRITLSAFPSIPWKNFSFD